MQIRLKTTLTNGPRSVNVQALHDTGAEVYAFIDHSVADALGLQRGGAMGYSGIAGSSVGFKSSITGIRLDDNPSCFLQGNIPVLVGQVTVPNVKILLGEYFFKDLRLNTGFDDNGNVLISCRGGQTIAVGQPLPEGTLFIGGAIVLGAALLLGGIMALER